MTNESNPFFYADPEELPLGWEVIATRAECGEAVTLCVELFREGIKCGYTERHRIFLIWSLKFNEWPNH